jgi:hypothetical protein
MKKTLLVAMAVAFALAGCAQFRSDGDVDAASTCQVGPVMVSVTNNTIDSIPPINVPNRGAVKWICWQLDANASAIYKFVPDSIQIEDQQGDGFENCKKGQHGNQSGSSRIRCKDLHPRQQQYKYTINVERKDGLSGPPPLDPMIDND